MDCDNCEISKFKRKDKFKHYLICKKSEGKPG